MGPVQETSCVFREVKGHPAMESGSSPVDTHKRYAYNSLQVAFTAILAVQVVYLVFRAQYIELRTRLSLPADILSSTATVAAFFLSRASHGRSLRPSTVLDLYLSLSSLLNIARTRTLWLLAAGSPVPILMTVNLSLTLFALLLESIEERKRLSNGSPEEFSGIWARISFSWLLPLLKTGYDKVLSQDDLPNLDTRLQSRVLRRQLITTWSKCENRYGRVFDMSMSSSEC